MKSKKVIKKVKVNDYFKLLPIGLILLIVPMIVFMKVVNLNDVVAEYWSGTKQIFDFFSYYKMVWFITFTIVAVIFLLYYLAVQKIKLKFPKIFIPLTFYFVFAFLSSALSKYHDTAYFGFPDRYEGFFTILCYILICFTCYSLITSEFDFKYLFIFLSACVFVISIIGLTQFFGFDFLQTSFGKKLILPKANQGMAEALKFNFPKQYIYSTLYNPNYAGGFFGIVLPLFITFFIAAQKVLNKVFIGILCILVYSNLIGSLSFTGLLAALAASIVLIIFIRKYLKKNVLSLAILLICFGISTFYMNSYSNGKVFKQDYIESFNINSIKSELQNSVRITDRSNPMLLSLTYNGGFKTLDLHTNTQSSNIQVKKISTSASTPTKLFDIKIDKNSLYLYTAESEALVVKFDSDSKEFKFFDLKGSTLEFKSTNANGKQVIQFSDKRFNRINLFWNGTVLSVQAPSTAFNLAVTTSGFKFISPSGQLTDIIKAESYGFKGNEKWGSNRGYIWSRSIPLLKNTIFLGHGPDTYAMYFPQNDYVAKMKYLDNISIIVDKPHNTYLQIAINTGVLSLIAFLIFIGWYCLWSIKLYFKGITNEFFAPGIACFVATISFLISSIANDSSVSVSPVFWILLGAGIACNRLYSQKLAVK